MFSNQLPEEQVALLRAVTFEGLGRGHFIYPGMKGLYDSGWEWAGHIPDPKANNISPWMGLNVSLDPASDFRKQVSGCQLLVVVIDTGHSRGVYRIPRAISNVLLDKYAGIERKRSAS